MTTLGQRAVVIRSKNAGPYELTFDIMFEDANTAERVSQMLSKEKIAKLYGITTDKVLSIIFFKPANAVKITIVRPRSSGDLGETDVYGAQQHGPLLNLEM